MRHDEAHNRASRQHLLVQRGGMRAKSVIPRGVRYLRLITSDFFVASLGLKMTPHNCPDHGKACPAWSVEACECNCLTTIVSAWTRVYTREYRPGRREYFSFYEMTKGDAFPGTVCPDYALNRAKEFRRLELEELVTELVPDQSLQNTRRKIETQQLAGSGEFISVLS